VRRCLRCSGRLAKVCFYLVVTFLKKPGTDIGILDEKLGLLARRKILERISRHRRLKSTGKSHAAGCLKRYESFCLDYNIPMFPPAGAVLALFYGTRARKNNASEATKRKDLQQLKSLLDPTTSLYSCDPSNKALSELQQYPGSTAALEEYLKGGTSEGEPDLLFDFGTTSSQIEPRRSLPCGARPATTTS